jgi:hypothetical protein
LSNSECRRTVSFERVNNGGGEKAAVSIQDMKG